MDTDRLSCQLLNADLIYAHFTAFKMIIKMESTFRILCLITILYGCSNTEEETPPAPPTNLVAIGVSIEQIDLSWTDNSTNEAGFRIERKTSNEIYSLVGNTGADVMNFSDVGLTDN